MGIAISDPTLTIAQPLKTILWRSFKTFTAELEEIIKSFDVSRIIVGLPLTLKGTHSQKTRETLDMVEKMRIALPVPVETYDERLTTIQAHRTLREMGKKPSKERDRVDQLAAVHLLQTYLDQQRYGRTTKWD